MKYIYTCIAQLRIKLVTGLISALIFALSRFWFALTQSLFHHRDLDVRFQPDRDTNTTGARYPRAR